jgi:hypothetical protein
MRRLTVAKCNREHPIEIEVRAAPLNRGGYSRGGAYYGTGEKVYEFHATVPRYDEHSAEIRYSHPRGAIRAPSAKAVRDALRKKFQVMSMPCVDSRSACVKFVR